MLAEVLGARRVSKSVDRMAQQQRADQERADLREREHRAEVAGLRDLVIALVDRLDRREAEDAERRQEDAQAYAEQSEEFVTRLGELGAAVAMLAQAGPSWVAPVADAVRRQEEDGTRFRKFMGARLAEAEQRQSEVLATLSASVLRAVAEHQEHIDEQHQAQAAATAEVRAFAESGAADLMGELAAVRDELLSDAVRREERQGERLDAVRSEVDEVARIAAGIAAVVAEAVEGVRADVDTVRREIAEQADATRALVHSAVQESAASFVRLDEGQGEAGRWLERIGGEVEAAVSLMGEIPDQVRGAVEPGTAATLRAVEVIERTGSQVVGEFGDQGGRLLAAVHGMAQAVSAAAVAEEIEGVTVPQ